MIEKLIEYLSYPFAVYALIVGVLISLCASLFGVSLVLKRFSFIGDGLSHVAFGALAIATVVKLTNQMLLVLPITVICAILLLKTNNKRKIRGDALIAMVSVGALALGYLIYNRFSSAANVSGDVCTTLFGSTSILTLSKFDVILSTVLSLVVIVFFVFFYNKIFLITFDENFAKATGVKTEIYNLIYAAITGIIIVVAMNLVGSLLISALIVFPALSAMRIFSSYKKVTIFSSIISVICAILGIVASMLYGTPTGSTIVLADIIVFVICYAINKIRGLKA